MPWNRKSAGSQAYKGPEIDYIRFITSAVLISLSGVMAPGPMTAVTVREGSRSPHAGALIALGHGTFEIPLMVLIFTSYSYMSDTIQAVSVKRIIGIAGGMFLLCMSAQMLMSLRKKTEQPQERVSSRTAWISGIMLSAANPYFLIWWATVGAALTFDAAEFGFWGFLLFAFVHWMCDLLWYYFLSFLSYRGGSFFGEQFQRIITLACALVLVYFGSMFLINAL